MLERHFNAKITADLADEYRFIHWALGLCMKAFSDVEVAQAIFDSAINKKWVNYHGDFIKLLWGDQRMKNVKTVITETHLTTASFLMEKMEKAPEDVLSDQIFFLALEELKENANESKDEWKIDAIWAIGLSRDASLFPRNNMGPFQRRFDTEKDYDRMDYRNFVGFFFFWDQTNMKIFEEYIGYRNQNNTLLNTFMGVQQMIFRQGRRNTDTFDNALDLLWTDFLLTHFKTFTMLKPVLKSQCINRNSGLKENNLNHISASSRRLILIFESLKAASNGDDLMKLRTTLPNLLLDEHLSLNYDYDNSLYEQSIVAAEPNQLYNISMTLLSDKQRKDIEDHMNRILLLIVAVFDRPPDHISTAWKQAISIICDPRSSDRYSNEQIHQMVMNLLTAAAVFRALPNKNNIKMLEFEILRIVQVLFQSMDYGYMIKSNGELEILKFAVLKVTEDTFNMATLKSIWTALNADANRFFENENQMLFYRDKFMYEAFKMSTNPILDILAAKSEEREVVPQKAKYNANLKAALESNIVKFKKYADSLIADPSKARRVLLLIKAMELMKKRLTRVTILYDLLLDCKLEHSAKDLRRPEDLGLPLRPTWFGAYRLCKAANDPTRGEYVYLEEKID
eukprot:GHVL01011722.1.p1 GENE.GHVL01011722.1~~GHVL01011722.1.p1  ORF type:complete len:625 (+),score=72.72 GHVL01011722.1:210-2084(+)